MSQENVEIIRRVYEQDIFGRDPDRLLDLATPDIEYVNPPDAIEPGTRRGRDEVAQAVRNAHTFFESHRYVVNEVFDAGDFVVVGLTFYARAPGTEIELLQEEAHTWTLREGRIARFEWGRDLRAALEAVRRPDVG